VYLEYVWCLLEEAGICSSLDNPTCKVSWILYTEVHGVPRTV